MDVLDMIAAKLNLARQVLQDLIQHYQRLDDDDRLDKSNVVMDEVNSYLQIEGNMLFPLMRKTGEHDDLVERARQVHTDIENLTEHMVMMHVDEPHHEYFNSLRQLAPMLDQAQRVDEQSVFPWARQYLTQEQQNYLATHLKDQTLQESIPSLFKAREGKPTPGAKGI